MVSDDFTPSTLPGPPQIKIIEENIDTVRNLIEETPNSSISNPLNSFPELMNTMERYSASRSKYQIITAVNDILPRAQAHRI